MVRRLSSVLAAAALATLLGATPALADEFFVTGTADGGGTCTGDPTARTCPTLRAAVLEANSNDSEDEIFLQAAGRYRLDSTLTLLENVGIAGQGPRVTQIDGDGESRVLDISPGVNVTLVNVGIQNGYVSNQDGGNIRNRGELDLVGVQVTRGHAGSGGGIANLAGGTLGIIYSLIDHNSSDFGGGGIASVGTGGADPTPADLFISDSTVAFNSGSTGGGILLDGTGTAEIVGSTIARNTFGGGIAVATSQVDAELFGTLLARNTDGNCPSTEKPLDEDYNLDDANTCALNGTGSKTNTDPGLSETLQNAGGTTDLLTFAATSPAVDMVLQCFSGADQRGFARITGSGQACDAGAYEQSAQGQPGPTIEAGTNASPDGTASFTFSSAEPGATFECRLDGPTAANVGTFAPCTSPKIYTGLAPGVYVFQVRSSPTSAVAFQQFSVAPAQVAQVPTPAPTPAPTATPVPQKNAAGTATGTVLVKLPGGKFAPLDPTKPIPDGSEIDTTKGRIQLTVVLKKGGAPQKGTFYDGIFKLKLGKKTTDLVLSQQLAPCGKKGKAAGIAAKKPKTRKLWGDGSGSFRTRGQYSAATVRGTQWLVQDSCAGTLTQVKKGVVSVFDQVKKKTILLKAGKKYLAKPRR